jgi:hypothetical protein
MKKIITVVLAGGLAAIAAFADSTPRDDAGGEKIGSTTTVPTLPEEAGRNGHAFRYKVCYGSYSGFAVSPSSKKADGFTGQIEPPRDIRQP